MYLKNIFLVVFAYTLVTSTTIASAQQAELFVISTYDYKKAIVEDLNEPGKDSDKHPYVFLHVSVDSNKNYKIREVSNYHEGILATYKRRNTLLFVHGDGANMDELIPLMSQIPNLYNVNLILFAWPAQEIKGIGWGIRNFYQAKKNASFVFDSFVHTINHIKGCDSIRQGNITLMFHSLGNLFAKEYSHYIINNLEEQSFFSNIILNAPAVVSEDHYIWADILAVKAKKNVYLNFNTNDRTLHAADIFIEREPLLGRNIAPPYANKLTYIDFSEMLKDATSYNDSHTYFIDVVPYRNKTVRDYYKAIINGKVPDLNDSSVYKKSDILSNMYLFTTTSK